MSTRGIIRAQSLPRVAKGLADPAATDRKQLGVYGEQSAALAAENQRLSPATGSESPSDITVAPAVRTALVSLSIVPATSFSASGICCRSHSVFGS